MSSNTTLTDDFRERHSRRMQDAKARRNRPFMRRAEIINYFCGITMIILALPDIYTFNAIRRE